MKGYKIVVVVLIALISATLFAEVNIPSEVDPSSGKVEFAGSSSLRSRIRFR